MKSRDIRDVLIVIAIGTLFFLTRSGWVFLLLMCL